jgi:hypothetical protein
VDREAAYDLAALDEGIDPGRVRKVITAFLGHLATCTVCGGHRSVTFRRNALLDERALRDEHGGPMRGPIRQVAVGATVVCPGCGNDSNVRGYDLEWVGWYCEVGERDRACRDSRNGDREELQKEHAACGMRVLLEVGTQV